MSVAISSVNTQSTANVQSIAVLLISVAFSAVPFNKRITLPRILGFAVIIAGVFVVARSEQIKKSA